MDGEEWGGEGVWDEVSNLLAVYWELGTLILGDWEKYPVHWIFWVLVSGKRLTKFEILSTLFLTWCRLFGFSIAGVIEVAIR